MNWLAIAPCLGIVAALAFGGWEYATVQERDVTIATMEADKAKDIAAAEKVVREANAKDAAASAKIIADLHAERAGIEEKLNAANIALATAPVQVIPAGCPDPNTSPAARAFDNGLPSDNP